MTCQNKQDRIATDIILCYHDDFIHATQPGDLPCTGPDKIDLDSLSLPERLKKELDGNNHRWEDDVNRIAAVVMATHLIPFCDKNNLKFRSGNGDYCFFDRDGNASYWPEGTEFHVLQEDDEPPFEWDAELVEMLQFEVAPLVPSWAMTLGCYVPDYPPVEVCDA